MNYVSIKEILSRLLRHPLLQDVNLEQAVQYTIDFIGIFGMPKLYLDKEEEIEIEGHRGVLPCDLISIIQVKNIDTNKCMRAMTDSFMPTDDDNKTYETKLTNNVEEHFSSDSNTFVTTPIPPAMPPFGPNPADNPGINKHPHTLGGITLNSGRVDTVPEDTFKVQGSVIFTSFKTGKILVSYRAIPVDKDGYPLLIDNPVYLRTLEAYIKKEVFTILFDMGKIAAPVLQNVQQEYYWRAGQCEREFIIPDYSEMQAIANSWNQLLMRTGEFYSGFKHLGDREYIRQH